MKTNKDLIQYHRDMIERCHAMLASKNQDYANGSAFGNLDMCEQMGACSTEMGILIRMTDKLSRLLSLIQSGNEAQVKDESVHDTCEDIVNYSVLMSAKIRSRQSQDYADDA